MEKDKHYKREEKPFNTEGGYGYVILHIIIKIYLKNLFIKLYKGVLVE